MSTQGHSPTPRASSSCTSGSGATTKSPEAADISSTASLGGDASRELGPLDPGQRALAAALWALLRQLVRQALGSWAAKVALLLPLPVGVFAALSRWVHRLLGEFFQSTQAALDSQPGDEGSGVAPAFMELPELPPIGDVTLEIAATLIKWVLPVLLILLLLRVAAAGALTEGLWLKGPFIRRRYWLGAGPWMLAASGAWLACLAGLGAFLGLAHALEPVAERALLGGAVLRAGGVLAIACVSCAAVVLAALLIGRRTVEGVGLALVALWGPGLLGSQSGLWLLSPALSLSQGDLRASRLLAALLVSLAAGTVVQLALLGEEGRGHVRRRLAQRLRRNAAAAAADEDALAEESRP